MSSGYPEIEVVDPFYFSKQYEPDYYPEVWEKCARCKKPYILWNYNQIKFGDGRAYCSRICEAVQVTPFYLIMSVPFDTKYLRRRV